MSWDSGGFALKLGMKFQFKEMESLYKLPLFLAVNLIIVSCSTNHEKETKLPVQIQSQSKQDQDSIRNINIQISTIDSMEYIYWDALTINNMLPLSASKKMLYRCFGNHDSIVQPDYESICVSNFSDSFQFVFFGKTNFEIKNDSAVLNQLFFEKDKHVKLVGPNWVLDKTTTLETFSKIFPNSVKRKNSELISDIGEVIAIEIASSKGDIYDFKWIFYFKDQKLVLLEPWEPC